MSAITSRDGRWWPRLSPAFTDTARSHAGDLIAGAVLFLGTSFAVGRVFRYPFDDEVYNLRIVETKSAWQVVTFFLGGNDIHPPLSYLFNKALDGLGAGATGMRLASVTLTLLALLLFHALALMRLRACGDEPSIQTRLAAVLLFGLCALAVSQGDALRWYPLFAAEVALAVVLYVAAGNRATQVWAAVFLGLAVSTNFLGFVVAAPFVLYRYGSEKQPLRGDAALWIAGLSGAAAGLVTMAALIAHPHQVTAQLHFAPLTAYLANGLGFFGGHALGIGRAWLVVPSAVIAAMAIVAAIDRRRPSDPANLLAMLVAAVLPLPLLGFVDPRSYLYLAPVMTALIVLYLARIERARPTYAMAMTALLLLGSVVAIAHVQGTSHPFKRNAAVPYAEVIGLIQANAIAPALVLSMDTTLVYILDHEMDRAAQCVMEARMRGRCDLSAGYASVLVVSSHSNYANRPGVMARVKETIEAATAGRRKVATYAAGRDDDAALKTRLTGTPLDAALMRIDVYR